MLGFWYSKLRCFNRSYSCRVVEWQRQVLADDESTLQWRHHRQHGELCRISSRWRRRQRCGWRVTGRHVRRSPIRRLRAAESPPAGFFHHCRCGGCCRLRQLPSSVLLYRHVSDAARRRSRSDGNAPAGCSRGGPQRIATWRSGVRRTGGTRGRADRTAVHSRIRSEPWRYDATTAARWFPRYREITRITTVSISFKQTLSSNALTSDVVWDRRS